MSLPEFQYEYVETEIRGLGAIKIRPLSRAQVQQWGEEREGKTALERERELAALAIEGDSVGDWLDSLPPFIAELVMEAVFQATQSSDDSRLAEKNS